MPSHGHEKLDTAIIGALQNDPAVNKISSSSADGKISITREGQTWNYFLKTSSEADMANTFEGTLLYQQRRFR